MTVRVRCAPSPTGELHIGSLRTFIFDWLYARNQGGVFAFRVEDTDQAREVEGAARRQLEALRWMGIEPDEGVYLDEDGELAEKGDFGPYTQSKRLDIYRAHADMLLESGHAYRCFCTPERLAAMREEQEKNHQPPRYDRTCRNLSPEESLKRSATEAYVIRHAIEDGKEVRATDLIRGDLVFRSDELDDYVLLKSDGFPTYQLANVVDDHLMKITHVLRGEEWVPSTPKNVLLYAAFGWEAPVYAHLPVILGPDGKKKLSKRDGDVSVSDYADKGYLPDALFNYLGFLGWSPGTEDEFLSREQFISQFRLEKVQKSPAKFSFERLDFVNGWYIRQLSVGEVMSHMLPYWIDAGLVALEGNRIEPAQDDAYVVEHFQDYLLAIAQTLQERVKHFDETVELSQFFFERPVVDEDLKQMVVPKKGTAEGTQALLRDCISVLEKHSFENWTVAALQETVSAFVTEKGIKNGDILWPVRAALTGKPASPGAYEMLALLGKDESLVRLKAVAYTEGSNS